MVGVDWHNRPTMWQFNYSAETWSTLSFTPSVFPGTIPPGGCMVIKNDELLLFGGLDESNTTTGQIYIYNIHSGTWRHGTSSSKTRARMACATVAEYLVVWGGYTNGTVPDGFLFYNIRNNTWVGSSSTGITNMPNNSARARKSNKATIIGGATAILVIGVTIGLIAACRSHQRLFSSHCNRYDVREGGTNNDVSRHGLDLKSLPAQNIWNRVLNPYIQLNSKTMDICNKSPSVFGRLHKPQCLDTNENSVHQGLNNNPQYTGSTHVYSSDQDDLQQQLTQAGSITCDPHGQRTSTPAVDIPFDPQTEVAQLQSSAVI
ncbi:hypothetical protein FBU30_005096 [Linnemannia zychae]|nr:hypothetical protein FBU30_005096 [Linnemannia zychae]